jgi:hypothetical protein
MLGQQPLIELINAGQTLADGGQHLLFQAGGFLSVVKPLQRRCPSAAGPRAAAMQARPVVAGLHGRLGPG